MRLFAFILSLFLLGLSVVPCADGANDESIEITSVNTDGDRDHESDEDLCSPFCVCQCCHSHFVANHAFYPNLMSLLNMIENTAYNAFFTKGHLDSILQPPQV
ncbi:MAG: DUF6660 family protein [Bacteroidota bacterium]